MNRILRYIIDVVIKNKKIGYIERRKFARFNTGSYMEKPLSIKHPESIQIGRNVSIARNVRLEVYPEASSSSHITIGDGCNIMYNVTILAGADVVIGKNVLIASDVLITSESHGIDPEDTVRYVDQKLVTRSVSIKENAWIGEKSIILPGVTIGKGSIVGAGSVVTKGTDDYTIVVGNPARAIKKYDFEKHEWIRI